MKKVDATYSDKTRRRRASAAKPARKSVQVPRWASYGSIALIAAVLCLTVNFRAYTELSKEVDQNQQLNTEIENMTTDNLNLQEEIYYLQNDSGVIEREARKFGMKRSDREKKVPVPAAK